MLRFAPVHNRFNSNISKNVFRLFGSTTGQSPSWFEVRPNILAAIAAKQPVLAFETAIVTHGLPKQKSLQLNCDIKSICKKYGVTDAPIGFINGKLVVGLTAEELSMLSSGHRDIEKIARLDFAKAVYKKLNGGTTVSATMWAAHMAGIKLFVTGGIGGVHRGWQETFDISSDLTELGRTPVAVICAGVKSILDIPATLEYLETMGVPVATLHPEGYFPAFHSTSSGVKVPLRLRSHNEAVALVQAHFSMVPVPSGMLIACPIPEKAAIPQSVMEERIKVALKKASARGITGKATTPFLLSEIAAASGGETVEANIELVLNNTDAGCRIAVGLSTDHFSRSTSDCNVPGDEDGSFRPVIVGGSVLDAYGKFSEETPKKHTRATEKGRVFLSAGGVGRNVADCIARVMDCPPSDEQNIDKRPLLISVLSKDSVGELIMSLTSKKLDVSGVKWLDKQKTGLYSPSYVGHLDSDGQYLVGIGDFVAMEQLCPVDLTAFTESISRAHLVVVDGNLHESVYPVLFEICSKYQVPVYIESTDIYKATRPFLVLTQGKDASKDHVPYLDSVASVSPNFEEFLQLLAYFVGSDAVSSCKSVFAKRSLSIDDLAPLVKAGKRLVSNQNFAPNLFLKLGHNGVLVIRRSNSATLPLRPWSKGKLNNERFSAMFYGAEPPGAPPKIVNVSGAGDCFIGTIIGTTLSNASSSTNAVNLDYAVRRGIRAACLSLENESAVPETITSQYLASDDCAEWCAKLPSKDVSFLASD